MMWLRITCSSKKLWSFQSVLALSTPWTKAWRENIHQLFMLKKEPIYIMVASESSTAVRRGKYRVSDEAAFPNDNTLGSGRLFFHKTFYFLSTKLTNMALAIFHHSISRAVPSRLFITTIVFCDVIHPRKVQTKLSPDKRNRL